MKHTRRICQVLSHRATRQIGRRWGNDLSMLFLCEYPKSGGTWLGKMIADCLQIPYPDQPVAPIAMPAVVHAHWKYDPRLSGVVHMSRDGRDIMVSFYYHFVRSTQMRHGNNGSVLARRLKRLFGPDADLNDAYTNLPRFISHIFGHPLGAKISWPNYIDQWIDRPGVVQTSYEGLRSDTSTELARIVRELTGKEPDPWRVATAVEKYSMRRQTGRVPGQENRASFIRNGVVGDWRNHFSPESRQLFEHLAGNTLLRLGYEHDVDWVQEHPAEVAGALSPEREVRVTKPVAVMSTAAKEPLSPQIERLAAPAYMGKPVLSVR